jgi:hypothetical protein
MSSAFIVNVTIAGIKTSYSTAREPVADVCSTSWTTVVAWYHPRPFAGFAAVGGRARVGLAEGAAALLGSGYQLCRRSEVERSYGGHEYLQAA